VDIRIQEHITVLNKVAGKNVYKSIDFGFVSTYCIANFTATCVSKRVVTNTNSDWGEQQVQQI